MSIVSKLLLSLILLVPVSIEAGKHPATSMNPEGQVEPSLIYVSDYFAFMGRDETGRVMFALDNNRGRDEDQWQAEHLLVLLHNESQGWANLEGQGIFGNVQKQLRTLPSSPSFQFQGTPDAGLTIHSPSNQLTLTISPIPERLSRTHHLSKYWMGSASGTLEWQGRTIKGVIIYEHLRMPDFNRLKHNYPDLWTESYGMYLWIGNGSNHLYLHSQKNPTRLSPLIGDQVGFSVVEHNGEQLTNLKLKVLEKQQALGFYQWPSRLEGSWEDTRGGGSFNIQVSDITVISNFFIGGLAMGMVTGEVTLNGQRQPIYGLVEVLK